MYCDLMYQPCPPSCGRRVDSLVSNQPQHTWTCLGVRDKRTTPSLKTQSHIMHSHWRQPFGRRAERAWLTSPNPVASLTGLELRPLHRLLLLLCPVSLPVSSGDLLHHMPGGNREGDGRWEMGGEVAGVFGCGCECNRIVPTR